ncbi:hypothetical protein AB0G35_26090 [Streptomyces sp. NPDC021749]|uniref:hypothetical protein n=1 Tax=Streptomyces sp. NPDC021749 TaxID=3154905 RepID=UPI0033CBC894
MTCSYAYATALFTHIADADEQWGDSPAWTAAIYASALAHQPTDDKDSKLPQRVTWKTALEQAEEALAKALAEAQAK